MAADNLASVSMVDQFGMGVPPFGSADIRAEYFGFPSWSVNQWCATALTNLVHTATASGSNYIAQGISLEVTLQDELCGDGKPFNKILLLFDEFGRYIEFKGAHLRIWFIVEQPVQRMVE